MTKFQIAGFAVLFGWLLLWAATGNPKKAARIKAAFEFAAVGFIVVSVFFFWRSPYVIFSNDGPLGQMKRATDAGAGEVGRAALLCFASGCAVGLVIMLLVNGCATKPKPPPSPKEMSTQELIDACLRERMNCDPYKPEPRVPHHQNPSKHNVTDH